MGTATLPGDDGVAPGLQAYFATAGRPENKPFVQFLFQNGLQQPDGIEADPGTEIGKLRQNRWHIRRLADSQGMITDKTGDQRMEATMGTAEDRGSDAAGTARTSSVDMKLEVVVIPVSDVDRAKEFYAGLGWRLDADRTLDDFRLVQFTPPGSGCSVQFGVHLTSAAPGSAQGLHLIVSDIEAAHDQLIRGGAEVSQVFHCASGTACRFRDGDGVFRRVSGAAPDHLSYGSFVSFSDPDGNGWLFQEVTTRLPGRVDTAATSFGSASDLADAMRRAEAAHGEHEKRTGAADPDWPDWYAAYMVAEQAGTDLPE